MGRHSSHSNHSVPQQIDRFADGLLTPVDTYRIPPDFRVHLASPVSIVSHLGNIALLPLNNREVFCTVINFY